MVLLIHGARNFVKRRNLFRNFSMALMAKACEWAATSKIASALDTPERKWIERLFIDIIPGNLFIVGKATVLNLNIIIKSNWNFVMSVNKSAWV